MITIILFFISFTDVHLYPHHSRISFLSSFHHFIVIKLLIIWWIIYVDPYSTCASLSPFFLCLSMCGTGPKAVALWIYSSEVCPVPRQGYLASSLSFLSLSLSLDFLYHTHTHTHTPLFLIPLHCKHGNCRIQQSFTKVQARVLGRTKRYAFVVFFSLYNGTHAWHWPPIL